MAKRSQKEAPEKASTHWYQDKYQHVLTQRNMLALVALVALGVALLAVFTILRLAPLKSVEPYLLQMDERTGITRKVDPISRNEYAANKAVDRYFVASYLRARETYNPTTVLYNYNIVRLMSTPAVFNDYHNQIDATVEGSMAKTLGPTGRREIKIRSMAYIPALTSSSNPEDIPNYRILQVRMTTNDTVADVGTNWVVTITFEYATLAITEPEQLLNPLGFQVISYQIQREL